MRRTTRITSLLAAAALLVAGCSASDQEDMATADAGGDEAAPVDAEGEAARDSDDGAMAEEPVEEGVAGGGVVTFGSTSGAALTGRDLARTASVIIEVEDIEQSASRVTAAAERAGGFVSGAEIRGGDFGYGRMTLRVPATALDAALTDLAEVGVRVVESSISTEDLTEQLTDLGARIANLERLEEELQLLLADVRTQDPQAQQLLQVFERLNQTRGEIERLEAQRAGARDRVSLATIHVELVPKAIAPEEVVPEPETTFGQAWQSTKDAFGAIADALIWLVVTILPVALAVLAVPALLLWALVRWLRRRDRERAAGTGVAAPDAAPPSPPPAPEHEQVDA